MASLARELLPDCEFQRFSRSREMYNFESTSTRQYVKTTQSALVCDIQLYTCLRHIFWQIIRFWKLNVISQTFVFWATVCLPNQTGICYAFSEKATSEVVMISVDEIVPRSNLQVIANFISEHIHNLLCAVFTAQACGGPPFVCAEVCNGPALCSNVISQRLRCTLFLFGKQERRTQETGG